jgi:hypothetical protein
LIFWIGIGLHFVGIPNPIFWGALSGLLRYVPYIGPITATALPTVLALALFPGWHRALYVLSLYVVIEATTAYFVEPEAHSTTGVLDDSSGTTCSYLRRYKSISASWPGIWKRLARLPKPTWSELRLPKPTITCFLPVLILTEQDVQRGALDDSRKGLIFEGLKELMEDLGLEANQALQGNGKAKPVEPSAIERVRPRAVLVPAGDEGDEIAAVMLAPFLNGNPVPDRHHSPPYC